MPEELPVTSTTSGCREACLPLRSDVIAGPSGSRVVSRAKAGGSIERDMAREQSRRPGPCPATQANVSMK